VEFIESVLGKCDMVEQVWVYGSSYESVLVAVVVPKQPALLSWAKEQVSVLP
jgi:long-chain acyl-CoA synthetase